MIRWKPFVEDYIEYVSDGVYKISFEDDSCTFRQFDASRMHFYGTVTWDKSKDQMIVEMYNRNVNRIVEKILRYKFHAPKAGAC